MVPYGMARWLIEITGEPFDLEEYPRWFPDGDAFAILQDQRVFLTGPRFDRAGSAEAVRDEADVVLRELFGVVSLLWPPARLPSVGHVQYEHDDGRRDCYVAVQGVEMRMKVGSVVMNAPGQPQVGQITEGQTLYSVAVSSPHLRDAIKLLTYPKSWGSAHRVLEAVEAHLGGPIHTAGVAGGNERERFRRTANTAEVGGVTARHALKKFTPPPNPMTLDEGYKFIRKVLTAVLRKP
jgi:hypothetical protein